MIERFQNRRALIEALRMQKIVFGNEALAKAIADVGKLIEVPPGHSLIAQDAEDTDLYLIIAGEFDIVINGRKLHRRFANDHVGEMAAIQPTQRRSASVVASEKSVILKLTEPELTVLGEAHPSIWRSIAKELARRLLQRNRFVEHTHERIRVFIICSAEALAIARGIESAFDHDPFSIVVWTDGVFRASLYPVEVLEAAVDQSDFAIAIVQPDDITQSRGASVASPRDNVIFELGMFIGRLGRHRSLLIEPRGEEVKLPSDLRGINTISYKMDGAKPVLGPACTAIRNIIRDLGPNN